MSRREIKLNVALGVAGMVATVVIVLGLNALGATDRLMVLGVIVPLIATSVGGWFLPKDPPPGHR